MKNKNLSFILLLAFFTLIIISCESNKSDLPVLGIVQITEDEVLDNARLALINQLKEDGFEDGKNIKIDYRNAQGDLSNIIMILKSFKKDKVKMIITNSTPCMTSAAAVIKDIPVVFTVAFGPEQLGIKPGDNLYGIYDPMNMDKFVEIMKASVPNLTKIGLPYNPSEANAALAAENLEKSCLKNNISIIKIPVNNSTDITMAIQSLKSQNVNAFVAASDNTVYLGLNQIADYATKNSIPLFITDPLQAKKGAALGFGLNYELWGRNSGKIASKLLKNEAIETNISPLEEYQIIINKSAAEKQGLIIPNEIMEKALIIN
ncbi:ABC transporter substrate-binding protein [Candidatus Kapaibacterium sp.]